MIFAIRTFVVAGSFSSFPKIVRFSLKHTRLGNFRKSSQKHRYHVRLTMACEVSSKTEYTGMTFARFYGLMIVRSCQLLAAISTYYGVVECKLATWKAGWKQIDRTTLKRVILVDNFSWHFRRSEDSPSTAVMGAQCARERTGADSFGFIAKESCLQVYCHWRWGNSLIIADRFDLFFIFCRRDVEEFTWSQDTAVGIFGSSNFIIIIECGIGL